MEKQEKRNISFHKKMEIGFWVIYILELLPLYVIAFFNVPSADDYVNGKITRNIMTAFPNIFKWVMEAWNRMTDAWQNSQGTYSSYFWSSFFDPLMFSDKLYFIGPMILLLCYSASMFALCHQIMNKLLKIQMSNVVMLYVTIMSVIIQFMPSVVEGIYWWSGAFLYTFFFSVALATLAYFFYVFQKPSDGKKMYIHYICLVVLVIIVEGSNYPTAILMMMVLGLILAYVLFFRRDRLVLSIFVFFASVTGLLLNVLAPGNSARMLREGVEYVPSIGKTLLISFRLGFQHFRTWFTIPVVLALVLMVPVLFDAFKKSKIKFRCPVLFSALSLGVFCGMFAPTAYSYGWVGPGRYMNIVYGGYVILLFTNEIYYIGWIRRVINTVTEEQEDERLEGEKRIALELKKHLPSVIALCGCVLFIVARPNFYTGYSTKEETYTSVIAVKSLYSGETKNYYAQFCDRRNALMDEDIRELEFSPYYCKPQLLYFDDITSDSTNWKNSEMASYYGKDSIILVE